MTTEPQQPDVSSEDTPDENNTQTDTVTDSAPVTQDDTPATTDPTPADAPTATSEATEADDEDYISIPRAAFNYTLVALVFFVLGGLMGVYVLPGGGGDAATPEQLEVVMREVVADVLEESGLIQDPGPQTGERYEVVATDGAPFLGNPDAAVTMIEFGDFLCGFCGRYAEETLPTLVEEYGDEVRFVYKTYPVIQPQASRLIASAALCAQDQDLFWEYHDGLYENQGGIDNDFIFNLASEVGLDTEQFTTCYDEGEKLETVEAEFEYGRELGIRGTPAFFVNGRFVNGAQDIDVFREVLDEELARVQGDEVDAS